MALDPRLLEQVLRTPEKADVTASPIVTAIILRDPANAADLVPALERYDTLEARNARRILCQFDSRAVPHLLAAASGASVDARHASIQIMSAMMIGEAAPRVRDALQAASDSIRGLLDDRRPLPDRHPALIERDFQGRLCDLAYILLQLTADKSFDQSRFRAMDDAGRDREITKLKQRLPGWNNA